MTVKLRNKRVYEEGLDKPGRGGGRWMRTRTREKRTGSLRVKEKDRKSEGGSQDGVCFLEMLRMDHCLEMVTWEVTQRTNGKEMKGR